MNKVWVVYANCQQDSPQFVYAVCETEEKAKELVFHILHNEKDIWDPSYEEFEVTR